MTFNELSSIYETEQKNLEKIIKEFPWKNKNAYMEWLSNGYEYVINSTRILALAGGQMPSHLTSLSNRFITHAAEETGHEKLLENDVKALGHNIKDLPVTDEMKLFHHSLFYWLSPMGSPLGIYGFVLALESVPARHGQWIYDQILPTFGEKACRFVKVHTGEDPDHLEKAFKTVQTMSADEIKIVAASTIEYSRQYGRALSAISAKYSASMAA